MTTEQKEKLRLIAVTGFKDGLIAVVESIEKQAAIDALAKAEKVKEISDELNATPIPSSEFERYLSICAQRGAFAAIQFDQNLFETDK